VFEPTAEALELRKLRAGSGTIEKVGSHHDRRYSSRQGEVTQAQLIRYEYHVGKGDPMACNGRLYGGIIAIKLDGLVPRQVRTPDRMRPTAPISARGLVEYEPLARE